MKLHRFNRDGVSAFASYRVRLVLEPTLAPPYELLEDPAFTELVSDSVEVAQRGFSTRLEAGIILNDLISSARIERPERDQGLWTWLTLLFFDDACPANGRGERKPFAEERLVAIVDNHQRFYRHLLLGPYLIVRAHLDDPQRAIAMLCNPVSEPGEIAGQLASRKELVTNHAVAELATKLYYDPEKGSFKRGAGSKIKGSPRRLADLLNQLDLTYYLYGMNSNEILALLPKEFDRFRATA